MPTEIIECKRCKSEFAGHSGDILCPKCKAEINNATKKKSPRKSHGSDIEKGAE